MNQQTRRQFFKTVATTCAGVVAAVVAPAVVKERTRWENDVGGRWPNGSIQRNIICKTRQMGMVYHTKWHIGNFIDWNKANHENQKTKTR